MVFGQNVLDIFIQITSSKRQRSKRKHVNGSVCTAYFKVAVCTVLE